MSFLKYLIEATKKSIDLLPIVLIVWIFGHADTIFLGFKSPGITPIQTLFLLSIIKAMISQR